jgi:glycosyltransferase involved in cell wall biosynthesis
MSALGHIVWVNHYALTPDQSGGTRHYELARELEAKGWAVTILATDFHPLERVFTRRSGRAARDVIEERITEGVSFRWLWSAPYTRNDWRRLLNWVSFARRVAAADMAPVRPTVVVGSSPHPLAAWGASRLARRLGVPFILEVRDLWPESMEAATGRRGLLYEPLRLLMKSLYRRADHIIVLAEGSLGHLETLGVARERMSLVPNGTSLDGFQGEAGPGSPERVVFVYAGAHGPANGLDTILDAAVLLQDEPRVRVLLVGDGPAKPALAERARELGLTNVEFGAPVPKDGVPRLLASADVGLMVLRDAPLFRHGVSPNKLFDYMAAGLPVVCNVPGEVARIVAEAGAGEQTRDSSARALADAMLRTARLDADARAAIGRSGRGWVERHRDRRAIGADLDALLRAVV